MTLSDSDTILVNTSFGTMGMKISELSSRTGVSIPSLKFYLREGLLPQGQLSAPNQADYSESHVRRAALIRALRDVAGLSIAKIKAPMLGNFGGDDEGPSPAQAREFEAAARKAGKIFDLKVYQGAPHAFANPNNPDIHYRTTAEEIWHDTDGKIDVFVCGVGSAGTITGCGRRLKELNPAIEIIAVEPAASPVLSGGKPGKHKIQGIGAGFKPEVLDLKLIDKVETVADDEAFEMARRLAKEEGIICGISSGAAAAVAVRLAQQSEYTGKNIVVILPDSGERYLSTPLFQY